MPKPNRTLLRRAVQIVIWSLLVIALLGPHTAWSVCLTGKCRPQVEVAKATCCCCAHEHAEDGRGHGDGENGGRTCPGCCVDLAISIDEAPMPEPVRAPDHDHEVAAVLPEPIPDADSAPAARYSGHDTGPPRIDRRTELIATTVLRE